MKRVEIEWEDSCLINDWLTEEQVMLIGNPQALHIGYLVNEDDNSYTLVMGYSDSGLYHARFTIPKGCVKSIKTLRVKSDMLP